jgi:hypothetical protein
MLDHVAIGGGDFSFGIRFGALDAKAAAAEADSNRHHHFPFARRLRLAWRLETDGRWTFEGQDKRHWEVICAECGDTDGPAANQTESIQRLRGPYSSEHKAKHAAQKHFAEN